MNKIKDNLVKVLFDGKAIRCKTRDQSYELSEILNDAGICWTSGRSMLQHRNVWDDYRERTAYNYEADRAGMMYAPAEWYEEHGTEVVDFDQIISEPQPTIFLMEYLSL